MLRTSGWGKSSVIIGVAGAGQEIKHPAVSAGHRAGYLEGQLPSVVHAAAPMCPGIVDWYMDGKINIDDLITHILPLERINEGFDLMTRGESIRSVVVY